MNKLHYEIIKEKDKYKKNKLQKYLKSQDAINLFGLRSFLYTYFFESITVNKIRDIYINTLVYSKFIRRTDDYIFNMIQTPCFIGNSYDNLQKIKSEPHIIVTYHIGIYLMNCALLYENGINFSSLISKHGNNSNGDEFKEFCKQKYNCELKLIEAENPTSAITMLRELRKGNSILVFIDGNNGASNKKDNLTNVKFLNGWIQSRSGVARIALKTKAPIVTILNYVLDDTEIKFYVSNPIHIDSENNCEEIIMDKIYTEFTYFLKKYPEQWEAWNYVYKNILKPSKDINDNSNDYNNITTNSIIYSGILYDFNLIKFSFFDIKGDNYVLNKETLNSYYVLPEIADIIKKSLLSPIKCTDKNKNIINHLVNKNILITNTN